MDIFNVSHLKTIYLRIPQFKIDTNSIMKNLLGTVLSWTVCRLLDASVNKSQSRYIVLSSKYIHKVYTHTQNKKKLEPWPSSNLYNERLTLGPPWKCFFLNYLFPLQGVSLNIVSRPMLREAILYDVLIDLCRFFLGKKSWDPWFSYYTKHNSLDAHCAKNLGMIIVALSNHKINSTK